MTNPYHLGTYPKESKSAYCGDSCIPMFTASLFIIPKLCNQSRFPSMDDWIKKVYNRVLLSHKKWNYVIYWKWMELEIIVLNKINCPHKDKCHMLSSYMEGHESKWRTIRAMEEGEKWGRWDERRKGNRGVNMTEVHYMYCGKCHNETSYIAQLININKILMKNTI
jgi:hypothetical protein